MGKKLNDLKCTLIQKAVYAKLYKGHKPNEWEPWHKPEEKRTENGLICRNDVRYGETYPNSFADIWYPDDSGKKRPVVVYFHGGGFIHCEGRIHSCECGLRPGAAVPLSGADLAV